MPLPFYRERHFYLCITCPCHRHRWMDYCRLNLHHRWTSHYCSDHRHHCISHYHFDLRQLLPDLRLLLDRLRSAFRLTLLDSPNGTGTSVPNAGIFDAFSSFSAKGGQAPPFPRYVFWRISVKFVPMGSGTIAKWGSAPSTANGA